MVYNQYDEDKTSFSDKAYEAYNEKKVKDLRKIIKRKDIKGIDLELDRPDQIE